MVCLSVAANYVSQENPWADITILATVITIASIVSASSWALFGTSLRPLLRNEKAMRIFNVAMALALVASLWPVVRDLV